MHGGQNDRKTVAPSPIAHTRCRQDPGRQHRLARAQAVATTPASVRSGRRSGGTGCSISRKRPVRLHRREHRRRSGFNRLTTTARPAWSLPLSRSTPDVDFSPYGLSGFERRCPMRAATRMGRPRAGTDFFGSDRPHSHSPEIH